jgi:hypothetical protein
VSELVEQDRCQVQQGRDDCRSEIGAVGEARVLGREDAIGQRPDDQGEDREQAPVEPDLTPPKRPIVKFPSMVRSLRSAVPPPALGRLSASLAIEVSFRIPWGYPHLLATRT